MTIAPLLNKISDVILNPLIFLMFAVAFLYFLWGIFQMINSAGSEDARATGRKNMMYGIIGIFIMVSVYGILKIVLSTFGVTAPGIN